jgi:hypothetical protein
MTELSRRWDEPNNQEVRRSVKRYAETGLIEFDHVAPTGPGRLKEVILDLQARNDVEYRQLMTDPNFMEDVAIMIRFGGIDFEMVNESLGFHVPYRWSLWEPTVVALREKDGVDELYIQFENLAMEVAKENPNTVTLDANGHVVWDGFKE